MEGFGAYYEDHLRQCEEIRAAFLASDLMKRAKHSFCELAFVVMYEGRLLIGKIDQLCELEDGSWGILRT